MTVYTLVLNGLEVGTYDSEGKISEIILGFVKDKTINVPLDIVKREVI